MKIVSLFKRIKQRSLREFLWELKRERISKDEKRQNKLKNRYGLYQILNKNNIYTTNIYQSYNIVKNKYIYVANENLVDKTESIKSDKVWICWFQGENNAPAIVRACINSIRKQLIGRDIIVLSNDNISDYIRMPDYITEKVGKEISLTHYSDILRVMLLNRYGGLWIDSTVLCTSSKMFDYLSDLPLFVYKSINVFKRHDFEPIVAESWLIYSDSNQKILLLVEKFLLEYWKHEHKLINYFLFHIFFSIATEIFYEDWNKVPSFSEIPSNIMGFEINAKFSEERWNQLVHMSDFHKLSYKKQVDKDGDNFYNYILGAFFKDE